MSIVKVSIESTLLFFAYEFLPVPLFNTQPHKKNFFSTTDYDCDFQWIICPNRWDCNVTCSGTQSCYGTTISGPQECSKTLRLTAQGSDALSFSTIAATNTDHLIVSIGSSSTSYVFQNGAIYQTAGKTLQIEAVGLRAIQSSNIFGPVGGELTMYVTAYGTSGSSVYASGIYATNTTNVYIKCNGYLACQSNTISGLDSDQLHIDAIGSHSLWGNAIYCSTKNKNNEYCVINGTSDSGANMTVVGYANAIYAKQGTNDLNLYCNAGSACVDSTAVLVCGADLDRTDDLCYFVQKSGKNKKRLWVCGDQNSTGVADSSTFCNSYTINNNDGTSVSDAYFNLINSNGMAWFWFFGGVFFAFVAVVIWSYWCFVDHTQAGLWWYERLCPKIDDATQATTELQTLK